MNKKSILVNETKDKINCKDEKLSSWPFEFKLFCPWCGRFVDYLTLIISQYEMICRHPNCHGKIRVHGYSTKYGTGFSIQKIPFMKDTHGK